jgi:hypothetical protein
MFGDFMAMMQLQSERVHLYDLVQGSLRGQLAIPDDDECHLEAHFRDMFLTFHANEEMVIIHCRNRMSNKFLLTLYNVTVVNGEDILLQLHYRKPMQQIPLPNQKYRIATNAIILETNIIVAISFMGGALHVFYFPEVNNYQLEAFRMKFSCCSSVWSHAGHYKLGIIMILFKSHLFMMQEFVCGQKGGARARPVGKKVIPPLRLIPPDAEGTFGMDSIGRIVFLDAVVKQWTDGYGIKVSQWVKMYTQC